MKGQERRAGALGYHKPSQAHDQVYFSGPHGLTSSLSTFPCCPSTTARVSLCFSIFLSPQKDEPSAGWSHPRPRRPSQQAYPNVTCGAYIYPLGRQPPPIQACRGRVRAPCMRQLDCGQVYQSWRPDRLHVHVLTEVERDEEQNGKWRAFRC